MKKIAEILKEARSSKSLSQDEIARELHLKKEVVEALEEGDWARLPEPTYVRGFIKNYADLLNLDSNRLLALFRAEYDERKFQKVIVRKKKRLMFTPNLIPPLTFALGVLVFIIYLSVQYTSILSAPKVEVFSPQDDITTTSSVIEISGKTEKDTTISIDGELVPIDEAGKFNHQIKLEDGRNVIEIVASYRLSPKTKITRIVRLSH